MIPRTMFIYDQTQENVFCWVTRSAAQLLACRLLDTLSLLELLPNLGTSPRVNTNHMQATMTRRPPLSAPFVVGYAKAEFHCSSPG